MKKVISSLICILLFLTLLFPVGRFVAFYSGYQFELFSITGYAIGIAVLSIVTVCLDVTQAKTTDHKVISAIAVIMPPLTVVNGLILGSNGRNIWVLFAVLIYIACCSILMMRHGKDRFGKIISTVLTLIAFAPCCFLGMLVGISATIIGQANVIDTVESPSGAYYAKVEQRDGTQVMLYEKSGFNALLFNVYKTPRMLYTGRYSEADTLEIYWESDTCLVINSKPYIVD